MSAAPAPDGGWTVYATMKGSWAATTSTEIMNGGRGLNNGAAPPNPGDH
ncbi:hypothetical protein APR04_005679 [Promicromonospora umidemergens]|uniref:Uncharacterized protein n=1 Tax=Promicromonospora umidemergens TaxID=629679 RepID=A0ABP8YCG5_9MICO|nr:hypothetical protein [Promicromonospora umidemergens]